LPSVPGEKIVYALLASDGSVHFYHFDAASGSLSEGGDRVCASIHAFLYSAKKLETHPPEKCHPNLSNLQTRKKAMAGGREATFDYWS
jgi:hypothetical protein